MAGTTTTTTALDFAARKIDNVQNVRFAKFQKQSDGTFKYGDLYNVFDNSLVSANLSFDTSDVTKTYGDGNVIDTIQSHASSGTIEFVVSRLYNKNFYEEFLGWMKSYSTGTVFGGNADLCSPTIFIQYDLVPRASTCGGSALSRELTRVQLANCRISESNLEMEARSDSIADNQITITASWSVSPDPKWQGNGVAITTANFDTTKPGENSVWFSQTAEVYKEPTIPQAKATDITAVGAKIIAHYLPLTSGTTAPDLILKWTGADITVSGSGATVAADKQSITYDVGGTTPLTANSTYTITYEGHNLGSFTTLVAAPSPASPILDEVIETP